MSIVKTLSIVMKDGKTIKWDLDFSKHGTLQVNREICVRNFPWIVLDYCKCPTCTLSSTDSPTCPVAEILAMYSRDLADRQSFERVRVQVFEPGDRRTSLIDMPLQSVAGELVRLAVYQSGCPVGRKIKPAMAQLPLFPANEEVLQVLVQYSANEKPIPRNSEVPAGAESAGPCHLIDELREVYLFLSRRIEHAGQGDVYPNAVVLVHSLALLSAKTHLKKTAAKPSPAD